MKLKYKSEPSDNGGSAVLGCGTIHKSEIKATLDALSKDLNLPVNLNDFTLGSTGKREYSGDIDVVLDPTWFTLASANFFNALVTQFGMKNVARNGAMVHLKYPIVDYDASLDELKPRTGYVQVDFNLGDAEWERVYHYSPGPASEYKGAHRNLAIAAITSAIPVEWDDEKDQFNRPIYLQRWKWSPHGFILVERTSQRCPSTHIWLRKQNDEVIDGPHKDAEFIARTLFDLDAKASDIDCLENILVAVKRHYSLVEQERIYKRMAQNFSDWKDGKNFVYPPEIEAYFQRNDK